MIDKKNLSERDICTKFVNPAIKKAGWDMHKQVREEVVALRRFVFALEVPEEGAQGGTPLFNE